MAEPSTTSEAMELDNSAATATTSATADDDKVIPKRAPEEQEEPELDVDGSGAAKKLKVEETKEGEEGGEGMKTDGEEKKSEEEKKKGPVKLGPKSFESSAEMFDYFYGLLHHWPPNLDLNKYEQMALLDLIKKGHLEPEKKIGVGIHAFQIRNHPVWKSRCFFLIRTDESFDDFSFRKCVDHILPLPENMKIKPDVNKALGGAGHGHGNRGGGWGKGGRGGGGHGRGHERGGKFRK